MGEILSQLDEALKAAGIEPTIPTTPWRVFAMRGLP